jgi:PAS domain S-box-containing protein
VGSHLEGVILAWNSAAERMFGYTAREAIGQSIAIVISPEFHRAEIKILERLRAGQRVDYYRMRHVSKNGTANDLSISVRPVKNEAGEMIGASIIARDTKRRRADALSQQLIEAQEKERTWIARELHDDIGQRLALLMMNMQCLCRRERFRTGFILRVWIISASRRLHPPIAVSYASITK